MQVNLGYNKPYLQLIEHLLPVMPHKSLDSFFRACSLPYLETHLVSSSDTFSLHDIHPY